MKCRGSWSVGQTQKTLVKVRHCREDFQIFLEYWSVPLWYVLLSGKMMAFILVGNKMIGKYLQLPRKLKYSIEWLSMLGMNLFWSYFVQQNTWIPVRINLFWALEKMTCEKNMVSVRINFSPRTVHPISTTWGPGKKEHLFHRTVLCGCFCIFALHGFAWHCI